MNALLYSCRFRVPVCPHTILSRQTHSADRTQLAFETGQIHASQSRYFRQNMCKNVGRTKILIEKETKTEAHVYNFLILRCSLLAVRQILKNLRTKQFSFFSFVFQVKRLTHLIYLVIIVYVVHDLKINAEPFSSCALMNKRPRRKAYQSLRSRFRREDLNGLKIKSNFTA